MLQLQWGGLEEVNYKQVCSPPYAQGGFSRCFVHVNALKTPKVVSIFRIGTLRTTNQDPDGFF